MDRLHAGALFVAAADGGSLAAAARRHGVSASGVTRAIALLEQEAGEPLMLRSTRKLSLTSTGKRHLAVWRDMLAMLAELAPHDPGADLNGRVVMTAPELFGRIVVLPKVEDLLARHPGVTVRMLLLNRVVNLIGEGVDLAIRLAPLPDSTLTSIRLGDVRTLLCASPNYLARFAPLLAPADLERHDCFGLDARAESEQWPFAQVDGSHRRSVRVSPRISVTDAAAAIDAALRGRGIIRARSYQVVDSIATGRLVRLLPAWEMGPTPAQVVFVAERARRGAVRALIDHLVPLLRQTLSAIDAALTDPISADAVDDRRGNQQSELSHR